jgi:hypothetical protein
LAHSGKPESPPVLAFACAKWQLPKNLTFSAIWLKLAAAHGRDTPSI